MRHDIAGDFRLLIEGIGGKLNEPGII